MLPQAQPQLQAMWGCHIFPEEIPDLVCRVFFKNTPITSPNLSRGREILLGGLPVLKRCQVRHSSCGSQASFFPLSARRAESMHGVEASPVVVPVGKLRLGEAQEGSCWESSPCAQACFPVLASPNRTGSLRPSLPPQMCLLWPKIVWVSVSCQRLKIRRFHIKTQSSGFSWTGGLSAKAGLHSCGEERMTVQGPGRGHFF